MQIEHIACDKLEPNPFQYRRLFPADKMRELEASINAHGVLQPILARPISGKKYKGVSFQIVAGERRWRAAQALGKVQIPAIVRDMSDLEALEIALIENTQREDPDDWATAQGIKSFMEMHAKEGNPLSELGVADKIGKSPGYVRNHLGLFKLRPALQAIAQQISGVRSSLFEVQKVTDLDTERELLTAIKSGASFSQIKASVDEYRAHEKWKKDSQTPDQETARRAAANARTGGGNVSRGYDVTSTSVKESREEAERAIVNAASQLGAARGWLTNLSQSDRKKLSDKYGLLIRNRLEEVFPDVL